jgi:hypothetical protein
MSPSKKIIISFAVFGVLVMIIAAFGIYPFFMRIKDDSEEIVKQRQALAEFFSKDKNLKDFQKLYREQKINFLKIENLLIDSEEPINFIEFLEREAANLGLFLSLTPGAFRQEKADPWPSLGFQLTLTGSFPSFLKFLNKLEAAPYLIEVSGLNIKRLSEKEIKGAQEAGKSEFLYLSPGDISASLSIKVFAKPQ